MLTSFLLVWLVTQAIGVGLVWLFTVGLGRPVVLQRFPRVAILAPGTGRAPTPRAPPVATIPRLPLLNAAWGGSIAIRREKFMALGMAEEWRGTLSEDLQLTNVAQRAGGRIVAPRELLLRTAIRTEGFGQVTAQVRRWD